MISHLPEPAQANPVRLALLRDGTEFVCRTSLVSEVTRTIPTDEDDPKGVPTVGVGPIRVELSSFVPPGSFDVLLGFPRMNYEGRGDAIIGTVVVRPPSAPAQRPAVRVAQHNGVPTLMVDGRLHPFMH